MFSRLTPGSALLRSRWAAIGAAVAVSFGAGGSVALFAHADAPATTSFVAITPCRLFDTRPAPDNVGDRSTPLSTAEEFARQVTGTNGNCTIPGTATAVAYNLTVPDPSVTGYLKLYPGDVAAPNASAVNAQALVGTKSGSGVVGLSSTGTVKLLNQVGPLNALLDITGYFVATPAGPTGPAGVGDLGCTAGQSITWSGTAWQCTTPSDSLSGLSCTVNQSIRWNGTAWECRSQPIVATLSMVAFSPPCCQISDRFQAYSPNVVATNICDDIFCEIKLVDVIDHTTCQVNFTGNSNANGLHVSLLPDRIMLEPMFILNPSEPLYINISCNT